MNDTELLKKATKTLLSIECQFFACDGFMKEPKDMKTCRRCWVLHEIKKEHPDLFGLFGKSKS